MADRLKIIGLGEILWDVFPDGPHFGGAPANFACSVAELSNGSADALMIGSVGNDPLGQKAIAMLQRHRVDTHGVSIATQPTGKVLVALDAAGCPSYEIATDTAWDNIAWSVDLAQLAAAANAVCFGTLAQRSAVSRRTIQEFVKGTREDCLRIVDINLRAPFWTEPVLRESLTLANVLKLNDAELLVLAEIFGWNRLSERDVLGKLLDTFSLNVIALTRGAAGATLFNAAGERSDLPSVHVNVTDTVGAGDAFTAALAIGLLGKLPLEAINSWAIRVAGFVCSRPGGTPHFPPELHAAKLGS